MIRAGAARDHVTVQRSEDSIVLCVSLDGAEEALRIRRCFVTQQNAHLWILHHLLHVTADRAYRGLEMPTWHERQLESTLICVKEYAQRAMTVERHVPIAEHAFTERIQIVRRGYCHVLTDVFR